MRSPAALTVRLNVSAMTQSSDEVPLPATQMPPPPQPRPAARARTRDTRAARGSSSGRDWPVREPLDEMLRFELRRDAINGSAHGVTRTPHTAS